MRACELRASAVSVRSKHRGGQLEHPSEVKFDNRKGLCPGGPGYSISRLAAKKIKI